MHIHQRTRALSGGQCHVCEFGLRLDVATCKLQGSASGLGSGCIAPDAKAHQLQGVLFRCIMNG